jgi:hypothetical protein
MYDDDFLSFIGFSTFIIILCVFIAFCVHGCNRFIVDKVSVKVDGVEIYRGTKLCVNYRSAGDKTIIEYSNNFNCINSKVIVTDKKIDIEVLN